ncbi:MAG: tyrosine--tRNA ligase [Planctomycetes bacterium]|nr:tyrosine--tRNA ligase [Planctomycetota bacterium]
MGKFQPVEEQLELIIRGVVEVYRLDELKEILQESANTGRALRVKFGMDPTSPDIHLGHTVPLRKLRQFQELGHRVVLIIGDYTAMVGDPSGKSKTRPRLSADEIERNLQTYLAQVAKVLDTECLEIRRNGDWFAGMSFKDVLELAGKATVAQMLERDDFSNRYKAGSPIGVHEMLYPLMQGWDSVAIEADIELGGTDQTFNLMAGRDLQKNEGRRPQVAITMPILAGLDGVEKMSKSLGNAVGLEDPPNEMFGKIMSIPDTVMESYFELLTGEDMAGVREAMSSGCNPRDMKEHLGRIIVAQYHSESAADGAAEEFRKIFSGGGVPEDVPELALAEEAARSISPVELLVKAGHAGSRSEARRLIQQGAVRIGDTRITDIEEALELENGSILRTGKRRFSKIVIG